MIVAYFDGDDIGPVLELALLDNQLDKARDFSQSVARALQHACKLLEEKLGAEVLICGGDDLVAFWESGLVAEVDIEFIRANFFDICKRTISVGIGINSREATTNLHRAKLLGKNRIVSTIAAPQ